MKPSEIKELISYIKKLVEVEVENKIDIRVDERVNKKIAKLIKDGKLAIPSKQSSFKQSMVADNKQPAQQQRSKQKITAFSKDPLMNKILQETYDEGEWKNMGAYGADGAQGWNRTMAAEYSNMNMESNVPDEDYGGPDMMDLLYDKYGNEINQRQPQVQQQQNNIRKPSVNEMIPEDLKGRIDGNELPDFLTKALTKNYSDLF